MAKTFDLGNVIGPPGINASGTVQVLHTTGTSTQDTMSQKAITDELNNSVRDSGINVPAGADLNTFIKPGVWQWERGNYGSIDNPNSPIQGGYGTFTVEKGQLFVTQRLTLHGDSGTFIRVCYVPNNDWGGWKEIAKQGDNIHAVSVGAAITIDAYDFVVRGGAMHLKRPATSGGWARGAIMEPRDGAPYGEDAGLFFLGDADNAPHSVGLGKTGNGQWYNPQYGMVLDHNNDIVFRTGTGRDLYHQQGGPQGVEKMVISRKLIYDSGENAYETPYLANGTYSHINTGLLELGKIYMLEILKGAFRFAARIRQSNGEYYGTNYMIKPSFSSSTSWVGGTSSPLGAGQYYISPTIWVDYEQYMTLFGFGLAGPPGLSECVLYRSMVMIGEDLGNDADVFLRAYSNQRGRIKIYELF